MTIFTYSIVTSSNIGTSETDVLSKLRFYAVIKLSDNSCYSNAPFG